MRELAIKSAIIQPSVLPWRKTGQVIVEPLMGTQKGKQYQIVMTTSLSEEGKKKAVLAIEDAFGKKLLGGTSYFEKGDILAVFHEIGFLGVGVVKQVLGIPYLDKFAVMQECKGKGLGTTMLKEIITKYPTIMLRASTSNACANSFYQKSCVFQWMEKVEEWNIYVSIAQGAEMAIDPARLGQAIMAVSRLPKTIY